MKHNSAAIWDGVEERFRKRLALWKRQSISEGGEIKKHLIKHAYLNHVSLSDAKKGAIQSGENPKGFLVGWWQSD